MRINFHRCIVDDKESGSADEFMVSRVFFTIQDGDKTIPGVSVSATRKQGVGSYADEEILEVSAPAGYSGPF